MGRIYLREDSIEDNLSTAPKDGRGELVEAAIAIRSPSSAEVARLVARDAHAGWNTDSAEVREAKQKTRPMRFGPFLRVSQRRGSSFLQQGVLDWLVFRE